MSIKAWPAPLVLVISLAACSGEPEQQGQQEMPPIPVTAIQVNTTSVTYFSNYAARVQGAREVEIAAQVSGILQERRFSEGSEVEQGETLFQIDPEPYEIQLATARAELTDAESANRQARSEWQRVSGLYEQNAVSTRDYEQSQSNRDAAQARVLRAQAAVNDAERNLRYTRVESPVAGLAGMERITEGNLVQSGMTLTHVTQVDPIRLHFSVPENDAWQQRVTRRDNEELATQAWAILPDGSKYEEIGTINFVDPRVSQMSASVDMRAEFSNPNNELIPGQFIRVRVALSEFDNVVLLEPSAISQGEESVQVFVVENNQAHAREVELGPIIDGQQVILSGINNGDMVVVNGHVALQSGASVQVTNNGNGEG